MSNMASAWAVIGISAIWLTVFLLILYCAIRLMSYLCLKFTKNNGVIVETDDSNENEVALAIAIALKERDKNGKKN
jgi:Na+-transporting methylmalonyl-CoA/oxaloacetate decarboxylase gamma subunit